MAANMGLKVEEGGVEWLEAFGVIAWQLLKLAQIWL